MLNNNIKTGDILFRAATNNNLSSAINNVTKTSQNTSFSHIGIAERIDNKIFVIHSIPEHGVCKIPIKKFINPSDSVYHDVYIYRLQDSLQYTIATAITKANMLIGNKYDYTYIMHNKGYYCSELIYEIFSEFDIFKLSPMTFKDPKTKTFQKTWVDHYKKLGIPIPEGELGCNPNGMAINKNLVFISKI